MRKIAVQDANILIDLILSGLISPCMLLPYQFCTTSFIMAEIDEEQSLVLAPFIQQQSLHVIELDAADLEAIQELASDHKRLSEQDLSAYVLAVKKEAMLLTGDNPLRKFAESKGREVYGLLWILDCLVKLQLVKPEDASGFLQACLDKKSRLPAHECKIRFEQWAI